MANKKARCVAYETLNKFRTVYNQKYSETVFFFFFKGYCQKLSYYKRCANLVAYVRYCLITSECMRWCEEYKLICSVIHYSSIFKSKFQLCTSGRAHSHPHAPRGLATKEQTKEGSGDVMVSYPNQFVLKSIYIIRSYEYIFNFIYAFDNIYKIHISHKYIWVIYMNLILIYNILYKHLIIYYHINKIFDLIIHYFKNFINKSKWFDVYIIFFTLIIYQN